MVGRLSRTLAARSACCPALAHKAALRVLRSLDALGVCCGDSAQASPRGALCVVCGGRDVEQGLLAFGGGGGPLGDDCVRAWRQCQRCSSGASMLPRCSGMHPSGRRHTVAVGLGSTEACARRCAGGCRGRVGAHCYCWAAEASTGNARSAAGRGGEPARGGGGGGGGDGGRGCAGR